MLHLQTPKMGSRQAYLMNLGNFEPARVRKCCRRFFLFFWSLHVWAPGLTRDSRRLFGEKLSALKRSLHPLATNVELQTLYDTYSACTKEGEKAVLAKRIVRVQQTIDDVEHATAFGVIDRAFAEVWRGMASFDEILSCAPKSLVVFGCFFVSCVGHRRRLGWGFGKVQPGTPCKACRSVVHAGSWHVEA